MDIVEWLQQGLDAGFIIPPPRWAGKVYESCLTHDGFGMTADEEALSDTLDICSVSVPLTGEEAAEMDRGHDPCIHVVRLNPDAPNPPT
jgi:hypothetical protein